MKLLVTTVCLLVCLPVRSALPVDGAVPNPRVPAVTVAVPPVIDGSLDEPCWNDAPVISGFTYDTKPPTYPTEVRVLCGPDALYFAFTCHDPEPSRIVAAQRKRNGRLDDEDRVAVGIDPRYDRQTPYWFTVNPLGTQAEDIPGGAASKVEWRGDWRAASKVGSDGWTAEVAIPFDILQYPRGQTTFGLMFSRNVQRHLEESNWPIRTNYGVHDNEARLEGVRAPRPVRKPVFMPYLLGATGSIQSNAGMDVKYTSQNDATTLLTVRPDFATIEDVVQTIDFSYNPRWLDDRRPFFTEGGDYYGAYYGFYSRTIGEVDAGLKSFGKIGPWQYAGMGVTRRGQGVNAVGRVSWRPNTTHAVSLGVITQQNAPVYDKDGHRTGSSDNTVLHGGAGYWKPLAVSGIALSSTYYKSATTGPGGEGHVWAVDLNRYGADRVRKYYLGYAEVSPGYTARLAYLPEVGFRNVVFSTNKWWQIKKGPICMLYHWASFGQQFYWSGSVWHRDVSAGAGADFRNDTELVAGLTANDRHRAATRAEAAGNLYFMDRILDLQYVVHRSDIYRQGVVILRIGRQAGGPYRYVNISQGLRLNRRVSGSVEAGYIRIRGTADDVDIRRAILSGLYEFSPERSLALRFIVGSDRSAYRTWPSDPWSPAHRSLTNAFLAYRQELRKGADIFVVAGDPNPASEGIHSQIAVKYVVTYR